MDRILLPSTNFGRPKHGQRCPAANFLHTGDCSPMCTTGCFTITVKSNFSRFMTFLMFRPLQYHFCVWLDGTFMFSATNQVKQLRISGFRVFALWVGYFGEKKHFFCFWSWLVQIIQKWSQMVKKKLSDTTFGPFLSDLDQFGPKREKKGFSPKVANPQSKNHILTDFGHSWAPPPTRSNFSGSKWLVHMSQT